MSRRSDFDSSASLAKLVTSLPTAEYAINVTVVYDQAQTRKWAGEIYQRLEMVLGAKAVRANWWNLTDLGEPGVLAGAVSKAMHADMIVLAVQSSEGLPLPFYFWVNSWLPHRTPGAGALVALLGEESPRNRESGRLRKFLRTVAKRTRMDLLVAERTADGQPRPGPGVKIGSQAGS
ncbi:MAG TPA: hypothetical protein VFE51_16855 [Verrucomicrobiae bacterium]|nr:hypothetical protein [Verrucomicrobiae bacterium]